MLATELALKGVNVRVNAIAPGVYASEMTYDNIGADKVDKVGKGIIPVPAKRGGRWVVLCNWLHPDAKRTYPLVGKRWRGQQFTLHHVLEVIPTARRSSSMVVIVQSTQLLFEERICLSCRH
jgi:NAD(P)-dependent dehydrogenase (short-subunit alcohol dehydrogenase family)